MAKPKNKNKVEIKRRNWIAVAAHFRGGAGGHKDRKKAANKKACRGKVKW